MAMLRYEGWPVVQTAVAAGLAWALAVAVLGEERPFTAAVAAVIALGQNMGQRARRALEVIFGVAVGIACANFLVLAIGTGPVQLSLVVGVAMLAAILAGGGPLLVTQAAVSAMLVIALGEPAGGPSPSLFLQALVGGGVALVVNGLLFPPNPAVAARRAAHALLIEVTSVLFETAAALEAGDLDRAEGALLKARETGARVDTLGAAVSAGEEAIRLVPLRRRGRGTLRRYAAAAPQLDLAVRNIRVLARGTLAVVRTDGEAPPALVHGLRHMARAVEALAQRLDTGAPSTEVSDSVARGVECATSLLEDGADLQITVVVGAVRSTAVDLLRAAGVPREEAMAAVRRATHGAADAVPLESAGPAGSSDPDRS